jgi:Protein of unknown function (DUF1501)
MYGEHANHERALFLMHTCAPLEYACRKTDKPVTALIKDLKQRGLLDSTLIGSRSVRGHLPGDYFVNLVVSGDPFQQS